MATESYGESLDLIASNIKRQQRKICSKELHNLKFSQLIVTATSSKKMRLAGHVALMGDERGVYRVLLPPQVKRSLGRTRRRWGIILK
jgi:hypothetical protein